MEVVRGASQSSTFIWKLSQDATLEDGPQQDFSDRRMTVTTRVRSRWKSLRPPRHGAANLPARASLATAATWTRLATRTCSFGLISTTPLLSRGRGPTRHLKPTSTWLPMRGSISNFPGAARTAACCAWHLSAMVVCNLRICMSTLVS